MRSEESVERDALRRSGSHALLLYALLLGTPGCAKIIGADFGVARLEPAKSHDASLDRTLPMEANTCDLLVPQERPANLAQATDEVEFTVVVRTIDFGDHDPEGGPPSYFKTGYDLDGLCTRSAGSAPCVPQPWIGGYHEDGPQGQDDAVALLMLNQMATFNVNAIGSDATNNAVSAGRDAPIAVIRVGAFGGLGEDDHVEVDWFAVSALRGPSDGGISSGDAGAVAPRFDTSDHWPVLSTSVVDPSVANPRDLVSTYRDANAFVTLSRMVAHFPRVQIPLSNVYFDLFGVTLTASVRRVGRTWTLEDVVMSGMTKTNSLLGVVPPIGYVLFGIKFCTDNKANYPKVKRFLCESSDLPATLGDPPSTSCTVTSAGAKMVMSPANLGPVVAPPPIPTPCPPETDPRNDSCDIPPADD
jgi:hypothetical protein